MAMISTSNTGKTLEMETAKIGRIKYSPEDIFSAPTGLLGFADEKKYILYPSENVNPFIWLQSIDCGDLSFLLIDPLLTRPEYRLEMNKSDLPDLNLQEADVTGIYVIASVPNDMSKVTLNMQGPLVFNMTQHLIQQVIDEKAELRAPLVVS